jgi:hypothetical protein
VGAVIATRGEMIAIDRPVIADVDLSPAVTLPVTSPSTMIDLANTCA